MISLQKSDVGAEDMFGSLSKLQVPLSVFVSKKLDKILVNNMALKCRGFLQRRSQKYSSKW